MRSRGSSRGVCIRRLALVLLGGVCIPLTVTISAPRQALADRPPVRSAAEIGYPPFSFADANGRADGFSVELLRESLAAMGREVTFQVGPWADVRHLLEDGRIDALPLVGRTPEREGLFDFSIPYLTLHGAIVVRKGTADIRDLNDLRGRRIGVMKDDNTEEFLRRTHPSLNLVTTRTFEDALRDLSGGRCDAVVIQRLVGLRLIAKLSLDNLRVLERPIEGFRQAFCFAVREGDRETLALLNEGLATVMADGAYRRLHARWFAALELPPDRRVRIGGDRNFPPFEFLDPSGEPSGFCSELTRALARETDLDVDLQLGVWAERIRALEDGRIDAIQGMYYSDERAKRFDFTQPFLVQHCVAVTRANAGLPPETPEALEGHTLLVESGDLMQAFARSHGLEDQLLLVESQEAALRELLAGRGDVALVARSCAQYWIEKTGWTNLLVGAVPLLSGEYCYAVKKGNHALLATLSEGLKALDANGQYRRIRDRWMGVYEPPASRHEWMTTLRIVLMVACPLAFLTAVLLLVAKALRSEVQRQTAALRESEEKFRAIVNNIGIGVSLIGPDMRILMLNKQMQAWNPHLKPHERPLCYTAFHTSPQNGICEGCPTVQTLQDGQRHEALIESAVAGKTRRFRIVSSPICDAEGRVTAAIEMVDDMTDRLRMEAQLRHAQKMDSVGRLAGGVAHDFNNMLMVILSYADMCREEIGDRQPLREWIDEILGAARRSADLTRQLLAFARKQVSRPEIIDLNDTVAGMLKLLRRLIGEDIELVWHPGVQVPRVNLDPSQLDQILANLAVNARGAIPGAGRIDVETRVQTLKTIESGMPDELKPGVYAVLSFSDNGHGMDKDTLKHIFEPFFTTKAVGEGTGLGLATIYGIVKQNGGAIHVYSEPGEGTTFRIFLPAAEDDSREAQEHKSDETLPGGNETVLLVEDEGGVRRAASRFLERLGYRVLVAERPADAVRIATEHEGAIDLLVSDLVLPAMNGKALADRIRRDRPDIKVLFISGYAADTILQRGFLPPDVPFLSKPFSRDELARKVREVLDA